MAIWLLSYQASFVSEREWKFTVVQVEECLSNFNSNFPTFSKNQMMWMCLAGKDYVCKLSSLTELCSKEGSMHLKKIKNKKSRKVIDGKKMEPWGEKCYGESQTAPLCSTFFVSLPLIFCTPLSPAQHPLCFYLHAVTGWEKEMVLTELQESVTHLDPLLKLLCFLASPSCSKILASSSLHGLHKLSFHILRAQFPPSQMLRLSS